MPFLEIHLFKAEILEAAHHQSCEQINHQEQDHPFVGCALPAKKIVHQHDRCNHFRRCRDRKSHEMTLFHSPDLDIETSKPESAAHHIETCRQPPPGAPRDQRPII